MPSSTLRFGVVNVLYFGLNFLVISNQTYLDPKIEEKLETREKRSPLDNFALVVV